MGATGLTIGVFDSGFGGLTVLRELLPLVAAHTASTWAYGAAALWVEVRETIVRYALSSARFLQRQGAQLLVVACKYRDRAGHLRTCARRCPFRWSA